VELAATSPTPGTAFGAASLRERQIRKALRALADQHHLVAIPQNVAGRREYDRARLLSEANTADKQTRYSVPTAGVDIPHTFFTNMWLFALTDTELAAYLALAFLRARFPSKHYSQGVYLTWADRAAAFRLTIATWRATELLHRYGLIDRQHDGRRSYQSGKVGDFKKRWTRGEVMPVRYRLNDDAPNQPALETIHRVLVTPTEDDRRRLAGERTPEPLTVTT
jgi:hypothetical protein